MMIVISGFWSVYLMVECLPDGDILNIECLPKGAGDGYGECAECGAFT